MKLYVRTELTPDAEDEISAVAVHPLKWTHVLRGDLEAPTWGFRQATAEEIDAEATQLRQTAALLYRSLDIAARHPVESAAVLELLREAGELLAHHGIDAAALTVPVPAPATPE